VVVVHGTTRTTYEPVAASVGVGVVVGAGDVIGRLQVFGSHCFPRSCLHWGLIEGRDHYLDPLTLVGAGPVRLLPLDGTLAPPVRSPAAAGFVLDRTLSPSVRPSTPARQSGSVHRGAAALVRGPSAVP
jgi:hypothetical protein